VGSSIDLAVVVVRGAIFVTTLQAAGAALFSLLFARYAGPSAAAIRSLTLWSAAAALLLILVRSALEPARMAGALDGIYDPFLRSLFWESDVGTAQLARLGGAAFILFSVWLSRRLSTAAAVLGIALIVLSFPFMGHTRSHDGGALLGALLAVHIFVGAFWFGALVPLLLCMRQGAGPGLGELLDAFSRLAVKLVPRDLAEANPDGIVSLPERIGSGAVDVPRSLELVDQVFQSRSLAGREIWPDQATLNIPLQYYIFYTQLTEGLAQDPTTDPALLEQVRVRSEAFLATYRSVE